MQHVKGNERNVGIGNYSTNPKKIPLYPSKNWRFIGLDLLLHHGHGQLGSSRKFLHHLMDYVWDRHFGENPVCPGPQHDAAGTRWPEAGSTTTAVVVVVCTGGRQSPAPPSWSRPLLAMRPCSLPFLAVAEGLEVVVVADNPYPAPPWHILASLQAGEEGVSTLSVYLYYTRETLGSFRSKTSCSSFRSTFKVCMSVLLRKCYQLFHKNLQFPSDVFH